MFDSNDIKYLFDGELFNFGCLLLLIAFIISLSMFPAYWYHITSLII